MKLRTELQLRPAKNTIDHHSRILLIGSCFSDHVSARLSRSGFDILANPHGILFNPESIKNAILDCLTTRTYSTSDLLFNGEQWVSLAHHGKFSDPDPEVTINRINKNIKQARDFLEQCSHLIVTLGTSWVYRKRKENRIVANCHKIPQREFEKELLTAEQILGGLTEMITQVREVNSSIRFIFTVSPVRHLRDGIVENTLSKARLHEAVAELTQEDTVHYFPSYEIMMDDLRDYRFYESDMIHPNKTAIDYIWEKFSDAWVKPSCKDLMKRVESVYRSLEHRPLNPRSGRHEEFMQKIEKEIEEIERALPHIRFIKKGSQ
jgi:hypothetical protein